MKEVVILSVRDCSHAHPFRNYNKFEGWNIILSSWRSGSHDVFIMLVERCDHMGWSRVVILDGKDRFI